MLTNKKKVNMLWAKGGKTCRGYMLDLGMVRRYRGRQEKAQAELGHIVDLLVKEGCPALNGCYDEWINKKLISNR